MERSVFYRMHKKTDSLEIHNVTEHFFFASNCDFVFIFVFSLKFCLNSHILKKSTFFHCKNA